MSLLPIDKGEKTAECPAAFLCAFVHTGIFQHAHEGLSDFAVQDFLCVFRCKFVAIPESFQPCRMLGDGFVRRDIGACENRFFERRHFRF